MTYSLFNIRWRLRVEAGPLVIQHFLFGLVCIHVLWRTILDVQASKAWTGRSDVACRPLEGISSLILELDWTTEEIDTDKGLNTITTFWMIGILSLL